MSYHGSCEFLQLVYMSYTDLMDGGQAASQINVGTFYLCGTIGNVLQTTKTVC